MNESKAFDRNLSNISKRQVPNALDAWDSRTSKLWREVSPSGRKSASPFGVRTEKFLRRERNSLERNVSSEVAVITVWAVRRENCHDEQSRRSRRKDARSTIRMGACGAGDALFVGVFTGSQYSDYGRPLGGHNSPCQHHLVIRVNQSKARVGTSSAPIRDVCFIPLERTCSASSWMSA